MIVKFNSLCNQAKYFDVINKIRSFLIKIVIILYRVRKIGEIFFWNNNS